MSLSVPRSSAKMLSRSVPNGYTFSPSEATPHLTINHDVAADLDSSNAFEGLYPSVWFLAVWHGPQN
jgi:S-adenosylmethionine decarboxylase